MLPGLSHLTGRSLIRSGLEKLVSIVLTKGTDLGRKHEFRFHQTLTISKSTSVTRLATLCREIGDLKDGVVIPGLTPMSPLLS